MKRIYMTLGLMAALATGAAAQDVSLEFLSPISDQTFSNDEDTLTYSVKIVNNGSADIVAATDTFRWIVDVQFFGCELPEQRYVEVPVARDIAAGGETTITFKIGVGEQFWSDGSLPTVAVKKDSKLCVFSGIYGLRTTDSGTYFLNDPDVDPAAINDAMQNATTAEEYFNQLIAALGGNNGIVAQNVVFGSGATDLCSGVGIGDIFKNNNENLSVYPNPATQGVLNFNYEFKTASNAFVTVTDLTGRVILSKDFGTQVGAQSFKLDISSLISGMYMIQLTTDKGTAVSKFTVK